ncbi:MAG: hypothetical protein Q7T03_10645, partial [Deltaproteobacteria bacterium]|nr:hypothetical protein [Deltaproteobacteria bacterium]
PKSPAPLSAILVSDPGCENRLTQAFQKPNLAAPFETPYRYRELKVLGSFLSTYIVCESFDGRLVLIDQHAAHERIGYEKLKKNFVGRTPSQTLLIPLTWEATTQQAAVLISHLPRLKEAGLEMEPFGGNTFVVKAVPLLLAEAKIPSVLEKLTEELEQRDDSRALEETLEHVLKTMACHAQVRAKDKLSIPEMEHLLVEMDLFQATHCPHGRPTSVEVTLGQIEGWFKRT